MSRPALLTVWLAYLSVWLALPSCTTIHVQPADPCPRAAYFERDSLDPLPDYALELDAVCVYDEAGAPTRHTLVCRRLEELERRCWQDAG